MKQLHITFFFIFLLSSYLSLNAQNTPSFKENKDIKGQAFLSGKHVSEEYSPKGSFVEIIPSQYPLWTRVRLFQQGKEVSPKRFFVQESSTLLFDSLTNGEYQLQFTSHLEDKVTLSFILNERAKKEYPKSLATYYTQLNLNDLALDNLSQDDTLQILYQHFGCFSFEHELMEITPNIGNSTFMVKAAKYWKNWDLINWESIHSNLPLSTFQQFLKEGKTFNGVTGCSNADYYTLRIKGKNQIATIQDRSCDWNGIGLLWKK